MAPQPEGLSPDEQQVRRLLDEARHTEPMPADVAARLDRVLADLRSETGPDTDSGTGSSGSDTGSDTGRSSGGRVADLEAARRRRRARTLLVAAAAVVVVGVGIDRLGLTVSGGAGESSDSAASGGEAADRGTSDSTADAHAPSRAQSDEVQSRAGVVPLKSDRFDVEVARVRRHLLTGRALRLLEEAPKHRKPSGKGVRDPAAAAVGCGTAGLPRGQVVGVRYDGAAGHLVFLPAQGDSQVVNLYLCGVRHPARSVTLPAP